MQWIKPYIKKKETDEYIIYRYNTNYSWSLLLLLLLFLIGLFIKIEMIQVISYIAIVFYFTLKIILARPAIKSIKNALKANGIEIKGNSKYSYSNPLEYKITKKGSEQKNMLRDKNFEQKDQPDSDTSSQ